MGIIIAPVDKVRAAFTSQLESIQTGMYSSIESKIDWGVFFADDGLNYNVFKTEIALFETSNNLTIYTSNGADGWWTLYANVVERTFFDACFFCRKLQNLDNYYIFEMNIWKRGILSRNLRTLKAEDGWEFLSEGSLAPFENAEHYKKRRIADRLNQDIIELYSEAAGFPISAVVEYQGPAVHFYRP